jgi:repressor LexA
MPVPPITRRQRDILSFYQGYISTHGISPTLEEVAQHFGLNKVTIFGHVAELERKGILRKAARGVSRALQLTDAPGASRVPVLGTIAAGAPIDALETPEVLAFEELAPPGKDVYALRVRGNSMIGDAICDGDLVLVERKPHARDGETVVAVLPGEEATLKRFYREAGGEIRLQPSNPAYPPLFVADVEIRGVVIGVIRKL